MKPCFGHIGRWATLDDDQKKMCYACEDIEICFYLSKSSADWETTRILKKGQK